MASVKTLSPNTATLWDGDRWEFSVTFKDAIQNMTELSVFGQRPTWSASNRETEVLSGRRISFWEVLVLRL